MDEHECSFLEEQEPEGRLILAPCLECGISAAEAIKEIKTYSDKLRKAGGKMAEALRLCENMEMLGGSANYSIVKAQLEALKSQADRHEKEVAELRARLEEYRNQEQLLTNTERQLALLRTAMEKIDKEVRSGVITSEQLSIVMEITRTALQSTKGDKPNG